ncbi:hypothetical protein GCM10023238_22300 [Streptomyces heliomycini]
MSAAAVEALGRQGVTVLRCAVVPAADFAARGDLLLHYPRLHRVAVDGVAALTSGARRELDALREEAGVRDVLPAYVAMAHGGLSPRALEDRCREAGINKLGSGSYASVTEVGGRPTVVLNGFLPALDQGTAPRTPRSACWSATASDPWRSCVTRCSARCTRSTPHPDRCGAPSGPSPREHGIELSEGRNAVHLSAGHLEGMFQNWRYFTAGDGDGLDGTSFGRALVRAGVDLDAVAALATDPDVTDGAGRTLSPHGATENLGPRRGRPPRRTMDHHEGVGRMRGRARGLAGRTAMVTGGAQGIGAAVVERLCSEWLPGPGLRQKRGARPGRGREVDGRGVRGPARGGRRHGHRGRQGRLRGTSRTAGTGRHCWVNLAAGFVFKGLEATAEDWHAALDPTIVGLSLVTREFVAGLPERDADAAVVNMASISAHISQSGYLTYNTGSPPYSASPGARPRNWPPRGIRVNSVSPGTVWNANNERFHREALGLDRATAEAAPEHGGKFLLKRFADPEEIAAPIAFLLSGEASSSPAPTCPSTADTWRCEPVIDLHTHHERCGHATGSLRDYVTAALDKGVKVLGPVRPPHPCSRRRPTTALPPGGDAKSEFPSYIAVALAHEEEFARSIEILVSNRGGLLRGRMDPLLQGAGRVPAGLRHRLRPHVRGPGHLRHPPAGRPSRTARTNWPRSRDGTSVRWRSARARGLFQVHGARGRPQGQPPGTGGPSPRRPRPTRCSGRSATARRRDGGQHLGRHHRCTAAGTREHDLLERAHHFGVPLTFASDAHVPERVCDQYPTGCACCTTSAFRTWTVFRRGVPRTVPLA